MSASLPNPQGDSSVLPPRKPQGGRAVPWRKILRWTFRILAGLLLLTLLAGAVFVLTAYWQNRPNWALVPADPTRPRLVVGDQIAPEEPWLDESGRIYLPLSFVERELGAVAHFEPATESTPARLTLTTENRVVEFRDETLTAWVNQEPLTLDAPFVLREGKPDGPQGDESDVPRGDEPDPPQGEEPALPRDDEPDPPQGEEPALPRGEEPYLPRDVVESLYQVRFAYFEDTGALVLERPGTTFSQGRVIDRGPAAGTPQAWLDQELATLDTGWAFLAGLFKTAEKTVPVLAGTVTPDAQAGQVPLRRAPDLSAPVVRWLETGEEVRLYGEEAGWLRLRTVDGLLGYAAPEQIALLGSDTEFLPEEESLLPPLSRWAGREAGQPLDGRRITLSWEHVFSQTPAPSELSPLPGLSVLSPTWFSLADASGHINNRADRRYVDWAHQQGYQVWGLVSNDFNPDRTREFLAHKENRDRFVRELLALAALYDLDGINIDFENVHYSDRDRLTQFVRELVPLAHTQGLTVSMDVTVMGGAPNWSLVFDRRALAEVLDYVALMTYDEHWASSPKAGSVASLPWVENSLRQVLEEVPAHKLLLGVPFYTYVWKEEPRADGTVRVTSSAYGMKRARDLVRQNGAEITWDAEAQQNYAEWSQDGARYRVWLEDEASLAARLALIQKYDLAGVAAWRRGFETEPVWPVIEEAMRRWP